MRWHEARRETTWRLICSIGLALSATRVTAQALPDSPGGGQVSTQPADPALQQPTAADGSKHEPQLDPVEVVVTGSRIAEPATKSLTKTEVIRRAEIERSGARNVAELLEERAGLTVRRTFAGSELWLRGLDPQYSLILVDGDRVPGQVDGAIDLARYGVESIERIEIVRGPSSALYGSDAIGGVVNIITRDSDEPFAADASLGYGQRNMLDAAGMVGGELAEPLRAQLTGGYHRADGFGGRGTSTGSAREQGSGAIKLAYTPYARQRVVARAEYATLSLVGVDMGAGGAVFDRTQLQEQFSSSFDYLIGTPGELQLDSRFSYGQFRQQLRSDQRNATALDVYEDNREHLGQITSVLQVPWIESQVTTVGLEHLFQSFDSARLSDRGNRYRLAPFAQHTLTVWTGEDEARFDVVPGARLDIDNQFGTQLSPKLALHFTPIAGLELRASYGRGFRAPSFAELLLRFENPSVGYTVVGNPDLGAETSHSVDVGASWKPGTWLEVGSTFFRNDLRNMIAQVMQSGSAMFGELYTYDNLTTAWTMGIESSAIIRPSEMLSVTLGYTWQRAWNGEEQRELEGRARHRLTLGTRVRYAPLELELGARALVQLGRIFYVEQEDRTVRAVTSDPLAQVDVRLSKRFSRHVEVAVGIDNLFDAGDSFTLLRPFTFYGQLIGRY